MILLPNKFPKAEHLCGEKRIARLFTQGEAFIAYPFRVVYIVDAAEGAELAVNVMVSVPKKRFKRAVKRNRLKRLTREAYRLNKQLLIDCLANKNVQLQIAFNYISNDELDFLTIDKKMKSAMGKLIDKLDKA